MVAASTVSAIACISFDVSTDTRRVNESTEGSTGGFHCLRLADITIVKSRLDDLTSRQWNTLNEMQQPPGYSTLFMSSHLNCIKEGNWAEV